MPEGVLTPQVLGSQLQNVNAAKVNTLATSRMSSTFRGTPGGLVGGPIKFLTGLFANMLGGIADDAVGSPTVSSVGDVESLSSGFFGELVRASGNTPFFGDLIEALTGIEDGNPNDVGTWINNLKKLLRGESVGSDPAGWFGGVLDFGAMHAHLDEIDASIANLNEVAAASAVTGAYAADIDDMPTIPWADLVKTKVTIVSDGAANSGAASGNTGAYTGSTLNGHVHNLNNHVHTIPNHVHAATTDVVMPVYTPDRLLGSSTAYVDFTPIPANRRGKAGTMAWVVGADTAIFSIDAYYMGLMIYNPATETSGPKSGKLQKVWDSDNIKDGVASTTTLQEVLLDMGLTSQQYTPGQILFIAHQQIAPGVLQTPRSFAAVPQSGMARHSSRFLDASTYRSPTRLGSIPSEIAFSDLVRINTRVPWGALSAKAVD